MAVLSRQKFRNFMNNWIKNHRLSRWFFRCAWKALLLVAPQGAFFIQHLHFHVLHSMNTPCLSLSGEVAKIFDFWRRGSMKFPIKYYFKHKLFFTTPQSLPTANPAPLTRGAKRWNPKLRYFTSFSKSICYSTINPISFLFIAKAFLNSPIQSGGFVWQKNTSA